MVTQPDLDGARPPGWIGRTPGYGLRPSTDALPEQHRPLSEPPRWLFHGICLGLTLWVFWELSTPAPELFDLAAPVFFLVVCAVVWVIRLVISIREGGTPQLWWLLAPVGGVLAMALVLTHAPLHARLSVSDDQLAAVAKSLLAAPDPAKAANAEGSLGRVGAYHVRDVHVRDGLVYFTVADFGFLSGPRGVIYVPAGSAPPSDTWDQHVEHFRGPWFRWWDLDAMD